jgi:hypothetical protein
MPGRAPISRRQGRPQGPRCHQQDAHIYTPKPSHCDSAMLVHPQGTAVTIARTHWASVQDRATATRRTPRMHTCRHLLAASLELSRTFTFLPTVTVFANSCLRRRVQRFLALALHAGEAAVAGDAPPPAMIPPQKDERQERMEDCRLAVWTASIRARGAWGRSVTASRVRARARVSPIRSLKALKCRVEIPWLAEEASPAHSRSRHEGRAQGSMPARSP